MSKGGQEEKSVGHTCLCNALVANIGEPQVGAGKYVEKGMVTCGGGLCEIPFFLQANSLEYTAADVVAKLLGV